VHFAGACRECAVLASCRMIVAFVRRSSLSSCRRRRAR
jgi:hypothetical protein